MDLLVPSCRVAFAALVHDLGKFAQRADLPVGRSERDAHVQIYCPKSPEGRPTHIHAAYTGLAFQSLEAWSPDLRNGDQTPFEGSDTLSASVDSLVNAASAHHAPESLLQHIVAAADRAASGFERENKAPEAVASESGNYITARLWSLFEEIRLDDAKPVNPVLAKPLAPLSVRSLFPAKEAACVDKAKAQTEYRQLWAAFKKAGALMPAAFRDSWPLWLDAFDSLWLAYTQAIPSATAFGAKPDVSLYDHSKATAAFAPALWRWCLASGMENGALISGLKRRTLWEEESILLIQGDFFGIQNFIFSGAEGLQKKAAKILRGRSFYISLLTEACALRVLEALSLPSTSQIMNAAGKFLIVAPNTPDVVEKLAAVKRDINRWFVENTCAEAGIGIAVQPAKLNDFTEKNFPHLMKRIFASLERAKLQRFDLFRGNGGESEVPDVLEADYRNGACSWQGRWPADKKFNDEWTCPVTRDEIRTGEALVRSNLLMLVDGSSTQAPAPGAESLELPIFGYRVFFAKRETIPAALKKLPLEAVRRIWDFSLPETAEGVLWSGFARRAINGYVPRLPENFNPSIDSRYRDAPLEEIGADRVLSFSWLARSDLRFDKAEQPLGVPALCVLKGDIDQLGRIFQEGLVDKPGDAGYGTASQRSMTFAKMATLSREVNAFFSIVVPYLCRAKFDSIYTVFAGGDDFCFVGPHHATQRFAAELRSSFVEYAACNPEVHFSAGLTIAKPAVPVRRLSDLAEEALSDAKASGRNAVSIYGQCISWAKWDDLQAIEAELERSADIYDLSTAYLYSLFDLIELAGRTDDPRASIWRSRLYYKTTRAMEAAAKRRSAVDPKRAATDLIGFLSRAIETHRGALRIPLSNLFYRMRRPRPQRH